MKADRYVIFKMGHPGEGQWRYDEKDEVYIAADQRHTTDLSKMLNLLETTSNEDEAMHFPTARAAYDWAGARKDLDWWKVGAR